jgi:hypothetical protein
MGRSKMTVSEIKVNIDLWPSGAWTQRELQGFINLFQEFEPASGQVSNDIRGMELQIGIAFAAGAIAGGFFNKLGSDLYETLKARLKALLLKKERTEYSKRIEGLRSSSPEIAAHLGRLSFSYSDPKRGLCRVTYTCLYSKDSDLDVFLSSLYKVDNSIRKACHGRGFPFNRGQNYDIHAELQTIKEPKWDVRLRVYKGRNEKLILNEFFRSYLIVAELGGLEKKQIEWTREESLYDKLRLS